VSRTRTKPDASSAGRIATSRRADRSARAEPPAKKVAASSGRGKGKGRAKSSPAARFFKLMVLLGFMACLGFGIVLVLDVGMTLLGGIHLGQITFAELVDKVHDRVFDKDLPEPAKKKAEAAKPKAKKPASSTSAASSAPVAAPAAAAPAEPRAELPAPAPSEYAKEAAPRQDVEVVEARERLDRLLKGL
jgi:hypothetical protein